MFAVIQTGGKQYTVAPGDEISVEKLEGQAGGAAREALAAHDAPDARPLVAAERQLDPELLVGDDQEDACLGDVDEGRVQLPLLEPSADRPPLVVAVRAAPLVGLVGRK